MSDLSKQSVLSSDDYKDIESEQNQTVKPEQAQELVEELVDSTISEEEHKKLSEDQEAAAAIVTQELQKLKKRLKPHSKSELITLLFQQGAQLHETKSIAEKLYKDNLKLIEELEKLNEKSN